MVGNVKTIIKRRKHETVGYPLHGLGLSIKIINGVGYREIPDCPGRMQGLMTTVGLAKDAAVKESNMTRIMDTISCVQFANDEKDYGMGLELGHNLFWSNYEVFDQMSKKVLMTAYNLLKREVFAEILEMHMRIRRRC
ncbi:unnamed protein product [Gongylonema pulchrum]|uniref:Uncharacterized protein n=1 Tax=Gongylonema pulchrum TaxID=637853 RepID=A0A3P7PEN0_9BILA|nr:unnamed protein product [Gongylonema pulchrum]